MKNWEFVANPPFRVVPDSKPGRGLVAWEYLKSQSTPGIILSGQVFAQTVFGVFFDAGIGFPVRMNVTDFAEGGSDFPTDYPALESVISGQLSGFDDLKYQFVVVKDYAKWANPPTAQNPVLPDHPLISLDPKVRFGLACMTGTRISVSDVLGWLNNGRSVANIVRDFPELDNASIRACSRYAMDQLNKPQASSF